MTAFFMSTFLFQREKVSKLTTDIGDTRTGVTDVKLFIDGMRTSRSGHFTQFFPVSFFVKNTLICPLSRDTLFSAVPPSNSLVSVLDT